MTDQNDSPTVGPTDTSDGVIVREAEDDDPETLTATFMEYLHAVARHREGTRRDGWVWDSHEALLLAMVGQPTVVDRVTLPAGVRPGKVKECFYNAFIATLDHPNLVYTEGFAMSGFFPVNHAWATDRDTGQIVDPTWVNFNRDAPTLYMGLRFSRAFMSQVLDNGKDVPAVFEADWQRKNKTLRCGLILDKDGTVTDWGDPPPF